MGVAGLGYSVDTDRYSFIHRYSVSFSGALEDVAGILLAHKTTRLDEPGIV